MYKYKIVQTKMDFLGAQKPEELEQQLNELDKQEWELIASYGKNNGPVFVLRKKDEA